MLGTILLIVLILLLLGALPAWPYSAWLGLLSERRARPRSGGHLGPSASEGHLVSRLQTRERVANENSRLVPFLVRSAALRGFSSRGAPTTEVTSQPSSRLRGFQAVGQLLSIAGLTRQEGVNVR